MDREFHGKYARDVSPAPRQSPSSAGQFPGLVNGPVFACLLLVAVTLAVFGAALSCDFISLDDPGYFYENRQVKAGLTWNGIRWAFQTWHMGYWQPLTWLSFMLDVTVFGKGAFGPHFTNLLFHTLNTVLLFLLFRKLTGAHWRSALLAGFFALHPLRVESVVWICERRDVMSTFFSLLALWMYARGAALGTDGSRMQNMTATDVQNTRRVPFRYSGALLFFLLALLSKPMAVTLPFVMLLMDYWPLRRFNGLAARDSKLSALRLLWEKIPFFVLSATFCVVTFLAQKWAGAVATLTELPIAGRIANMFVSYGRHLANTLWPAQLALPYPYRERWPTEQVILAAVLLAALTFGALWLGRRRRYPVTGWFWFLGTLIPVIGLVQVGPQSMADRFTYVPAIGLFIGLVWGAGELLSAWRFPKTLVGVLSASALLGYGLQTRNQLSYWQDSGTLFSHAIAVTENNDVAYCNLGLYVQKKGRIDEAMANYRKALQANPNNTVALNNLGCALIRRQQYGEGMSYLESALQLKPDYVEALNNLGYALLQRQQYAEGVNCLESALRLEPDCAETLSNLGDAHFKLGRMEEAVAYYRRALGIDPNCPEVQSSLGSALSRLERTDEAIQQFKEALRLKPDSAETHYNLGIACAKVGRMDEAVAQYRQALQIKPDFVAALNNLGRVLEEQKRYDEATTCYETALHVNPDLALVRLNLGRVLAQTGRFDDAAAHLMKATQLEPNNPGAHFELGRALVRLGRRDEAAGHLREALRLRLDDAGAKAAGSPVAEPVKP